MTDFKKYQSPFSWRYGSDNMRQIFSELNRRSTWRRVWVALARAQHKADLITEEELADIVKNSSNIDIEKSRKVEKEIYHDVMAEIKVFSHLATKGGGKIHLGATSTDITDNADIIIYRQALEIIEQKIYKLLLAYKEKIEKYKDLVCMGYTHIQPAEPTTLGYRMTMYAQDLINDLKIIRYVKAQLKGKGIKGAVGTSASYEDLLKGTKMDSIELSSQVMKDLKIDEVLVSSQTYPRKLDLIIIFALSSVAQSLSKFALDLRIMQSPSIGEWSEPRSSKRVGSSAMPFKRNPDKAEKICSLARFIAGQINISWENAANSILERTLDDSANKRIIIPETFLACDEILSESSNLVGALVVYENNIKRNLEKFGLFAGCESLMMEAVKRGGDRQVIHEAIRKASMKAWEAISEGKNNPLVDLIKNDRIITTQIKKDEIENLINPASHIGVAQKRVKLFLEELEKEI